MGEEGDEAGGRRDETSEKSRGRAAEGKGRAAEDKSGTAGTRYDGGDGINAPDDASMSPSIFLHRPSAVSFSSSTAVVRPYVTYNFRIA